MICELRFCFNFFFSFSFVVGFIVSFMAFGIILIFVVAALKIGIHGLNYALRGSEVRIRQYHIKLNIYKHTYIYIVGIGNYNQLTYHNRKTIYKTNFACELFELSHFTYTNRLLLLLYNIIIYHILQGIYYNIIYYKEYIFCFCKFA